MKAHIGVDAGSGYIHTVTATAANAHDIAEAAKSIRADDKAVYGDSGYIGLAKRSEIGGDARKSAIDYRISLRFSKLRQHKGSAGNNWDRSIERMKSFVRGKAEHPFRPVKTVFGYRKAVYRGISKNPDRLYMLFASANLWVCARSGSLGVQLSPPSVAGKRLRETSRKEQRQTTDWDRSDGFDAFMKSI